MQTLDLKRWKKCVKADLKDGKALRKFASNYIDDDVRADIEKQLEDITDPEDVGLVFDMYLKGDYQTVRKLVTLTNEINKYL